MQPFRPNNYTRLDGNDFYVVQRNPQNHIMLLWGPTAPTNSTAGFAKGCVFINTTTGAITRNNGTSASCDFEAVFSGEMQTLATTALTTITPADAEGTPDYAIAAVINSSAYGFASAQEAITVLYVIRNLQLRVAQLETHLTTLGLVGV